MTGWLDGKRALVVGGGSGIGRAVVDAFLAEGACVAVLERDPNKCRVLREHLPQVPVIEGDATRAADNDAAVAAAVAAFGGLDTLVNCVGIFDFYQGIGDIPADTLDVAFDEMFRTNVLSHMHSVKAAYRNCASTADRRSCWRSLPRRSIPDEAECSTCHPNLPYAGWSPPWPTSSPQIFASTESPQAAR